MAKNIYIIAGPNGAGKTTFAKKFLLLERLKKLGYRLHLFFLWIPDVNLAIKRVQDRVRQGGHSVPVEDIRRRFERGLKQFFHEYMALSDNWIIFDNSAETPHKIAYGTHSNIEVSDSTVYENLKNKAGIL